MPLTTYDGCDDGKLIVKIFVCICSQGAVGAPPSGTMRSFVTSIQRWEGDSSLPQKTQRASRCMGPRLLITQFARWDPSQ